nr:reverse transcriptase domain-containing protein [Tanacetum cinerariifolium]
MLPVNQIDTFYNGLTLRHRDTINAAAGGTFMKRRPEECYDLIENMTAHHNDWDTSAQRSESSSSITSSFDTKIAALKAKMAKINKNFMRVLQPPLVKPIIYMLREPTKVILTNLKGNNQGRNQFFQGASHGQNPPLAYQAPAYQATGYQAPVHQPLIPQPQVVTTNEFTNYMKANDAILKNMQTNMTSLTNSNLELKNTFGQFMKMNTASSSGSETLQSKTITKPKEDLKGISIRSGTAYQGPMIPITSSLPPVVERKTEVTKDTVHPTNNGSTKLVQPPVIQTKIPIQNSKPVVAPIIEPVVAPISAPKPNLKPSIPYPSRLHDQKLNNKANDQKETFFQIFKDLDFNISFTDPLILMPKFGPTIKTLLTNKDKLSELARTPLNEHCSAVLLKKLPEKLRDPGKFLIPCDFSRMDECLALVDLGASINLMLLSVSEDVFVKIGTFHFPADFVVVDFDADPRVPLILERSFLKTGRDVFEGELTPRVGKEAITFNLDQTSRYSANYNDTTANRIDVIDMACEEYSNFLLEEVDAFLALDDDPTSPEVDHSYFDPKGDILLLEAFLNDDPSLSPPNHGNYLPQVRKELKIYELNLINLPLMNLPRLNLRTYLPISNMHFWKGGFTVVESKENELIPTRLVTGWRVCIDYQKLNEATRKDHFPLPFMDQMLERLAGNEYYCFLDESNYTTTEKEMLAVVYAFEKFWSYFILNKSIVYTDHSALKYLFAKKYSKARLLRWVLLLQEFKFKVIDTKRAENLAADHLSRFENPYQNVLDLKEINESFPLETLNMVSFRGNSSTPWVADFANYHAENFIVKEMSSQQKNKFFKDLKHYLREDPFFLNLCISSHPKIWNPLAIISDRGMHFCNDQFAKVMLKYGVTHRLATAYHP